MNVVQDWRVEVTLEEVFRLQSSDPAAIRERRPGLYALTEQAVSESLSLFQPVVFHHRLAVEQVLPQQILLEGDYSLRSPLLARRLVSAQAICAVICSVGEPISARASQAMAAHQSAYGYALDCAGTLALESLARHFCSDLESRAAETGLKISRRFSPGLKSWPVTRGQPEIFAILGPHNKSVELTPSMQMLPVKSLSFVVGLGPDLKQTGSECSDCSMRARCLHRSGCRPGK